MVVSTKIAPLSAPMLAQGLIEKAFPNGLEACTERVRLSRADNGREPPDGGFAMLRGILAGALAEHELHQYADGRGFSIDLQEVLDGIVATRRLPYGSGR